MFKILVSMQEMFFIMPTSSVNLHLDTKSKEGMAKYMYPVLFMIKILLIVAMQLLWLKMIYDCFQCFCLALKVQILDGSKDVSGCFIKETINKCASYKSSSQYLLLAWLYKNI